MILKVKLSQIDGFFALTIEAASFLFKDFCTSLDLAGALINL